MVQARSDGGASWRKARLAVSNLRGEGSRNAAFGFIRQTKINLPRQLIAENRSKFKFHREAVGEHFRDSHVPLPPEQRYSRCETGMIRGHVKAFSAGDLDGICGKTVRDDKDIDGRLHF